MNLAQFWRSAAALLFGSLLVFGQQQLATFPGRGTGQTDLIPTYSVPNLIEGREMSSPLGVAIDATNGYIYIADTANNRVLAWRSVDKAVGGSLADLIIGQPQRTTADQLGPGTNCSTCLALPTGVAVDSPGNLYVVDAANNRILRYPNPFNQPIGPNDAFVPDFVIGQANFSSRLPNRNQPTADANTIATSLSGNSGVRSSFHAALAFDSKGNLWFTDPANHRVLRYPASALTPGSPLGPNADVVLGQAEFNQRLSPGSNISGQNLKSSLFEPAGLAFDGAGRLYVADGIFRVLVYVPNANGDFSKGQAAARVIGIQITPAPNTAPPPRINEYTLGGSQQAKPPEGVFVYKGFVFVADTGNHRITRYAPFEQWPAETASAPSPPANAVFGQIDFNRGDSTGINRGRRAPDANTLWEPRFAIASQDKAYIVDTQNHRVLTIPLVDNKLADNANGVIGQPAFTTNAENRTDGKEFYFNGIFVQAGGGFSSAGVAVDRSVEPPILYVADTNNNRVLGYRDLNRIVSGQKADLVIGQADFQTTTANAFTSDVGLTDAKGLFLPSAVAVDRDGNLYVADSGNARIVRFPKPFSQTEQKANLVLGQSVLAGVPIKDPTNRNLAFPVGLAFSTDGSLAVSDLSQHRVLFFRKAAADFTNGQAADFVLGQANFNGNNAGGGVNQFSSPRQIAIDTDDRLYVADTGNGRISIFERVPNAGTNQSATLVLGGVGTPTSIAIHPTTGEIYVAAYTSNPDLLRYPRYDLLAANTQPVAGFRSSGSLSLAFDQYGDLVSAEGINRVVVFFPSMTETHSANFGRLPVAPGMIATLFGTFPGVDTASVAALPIAKQLGNARVVVNQIPSPLFYVSSTQINFQVPKATPTAGGTVIQVEDTRTDRILAITFVDTARALPGAFEAGARNGNLVSLAATNQDGKANTQANPAKVGTIVSLYLTGQGLIDNMPDDGVPAPGALPTPVAPDVFMNGVKATVQYSGLAPGFVGLWQVNAQVPDNSVPVNNVLQNVVVVYGGRASNALDLSANPQRILGFLWVTR